MDNAMVPLVPASVDPAEIQGIYDEMLDKCRHDPDNFGRYLRDAVGCSSSELSDEEAREMWEDCWPSID